MRWFPVWCVGLLSCQPSVPPVADAVNAAPPKLGSVPAFSLMERSGTTVGNELLKGKIWVASFVFTRCSGPCPQVTGTVAKLHQEFKDQPNLRFVTFTIDPDRDSLEDLKKYADRYQADSDRWLFLTGKEATIHELANDGFKLLAARSEKPKPGEEFDHSSKLVVVDGEGHIRGYFDGMAADRPGGKESYDASQAKLRETLKTLVK